MQLYSSLSHFGVDASLVDITRLRVLTIENTWKYLKAAIVQPVFAIV